MCSAAHESNVLRHDIVSLIERLNVSKDDFFHIFRVKYFKNP